MIGSSAIYDGCVEEHVGANKTHAWWSVEFRQPNLAISFSLLLNLHTSLHASLLHPWTGLHMCAGCGSDCKRLFSCCTVDLGLMPASSSTLD